MGGLSRRPARWRSECGGGGAAGGRRGRAAPLPRALLAGKGRLRGKASLPCAGRAVPFPSAGSCWGGGGGAGSVPSPSVPAPPLSTAPGAEGCGAARRVAGAARRAVPTPGLRAAARAPGGGPGASCPREEEGGPEAALRGGEGYGSWQVQSLRVPSVWHCGFINSR